MNSKILIDLFESLNHYYFDGQLDRPKFVKYTGNGDTTIFDINEPTWGYYYDGTVYYHRKNRGALARGTIAHELIHMYQDTVLGLDLDTMSEAEGHGPTFETIAVVMRQGGLKI